jgi:RHS repeat-associated protein
MDRMVALAQSTSASLKVTRAPASGRVRAHQPKPATADSRSTLASPFSIAQQNRSLLHRAATTLQPNVASRYHCNQQYSITAITSSTGSVLERYAYTAYGVPSICNASGTLLTASAHNNRYTYTGREWDNDINQYHYRARMYDASLGRFCGRDPEQYVDSLNLFENSFGLGGTDPEGTEVYDCKSREKKFQPSVRNIDNSNDTQITKWLKKLEKLLKVRERVLDVYWDFQGAGSLKTTDCMESCNVAECNRTRTIAAPLQTRELVAKGTLLIGVSARFQAGAIPLSISGDIRGSVDIAARKYYGGCDGLRVFRGCGSLSLGGQIKICVGRRQFAEACVIFKLECKAYSSCTEGLGEVLPSAPMCKASISGSACIGNNWLCGEIDFVSGGFDLPMF